MHQRQVGVCSSLWSERRKGASKTLIMCRTTGTGHWEHQADTDFHDHVGHHRQDAVGGQVLRLVYEGQIGRPLVLPDFGGYAPLVA